MTHTTLVTFEAELSTTIRLVCEVAVDGTVSPQHAVFEATTRLHRAIGNRSPSGIAFSWHLTDVQDVG